MKHCSALLLAALVRPSIALADSPEPARAALPRSAAAAAGLRLVLRANGLQQETVRDAIGRELGIEVSSGSGRTGATLTIDDDRRGHFVMTFQNGDDPPVVRAISKPEGEGPSIEVLALLAGNLVRSEAEALLAELRARDAEAGAPPAEQPPPSVEPAAGENASHPSTEGPTVAPTPAAAPARPSVERIEDRPIRWISLAVFHPLSLPADSEQYRYRFDIGLLYSRVGGIEGFSLNPLVTRIDGRWSGMLLDGLGSYAGGNGEGARVSGAANVSHGGIAGLEIAGAANVDFGHVSPAGHSAPSSGARVAGAYNHATRAVSGVQIAGAGNVTLDEVRGADIAGAFDVVRGDMTGAEVAGAVNVVTGSGVGAQVAGATNVTTGRFEGAQIAGAVNVAGGEATGVQASGAVNVATDRFRGLQLSVVNVGGHVEGAQVGIVNYAEELEGMSLGLVPLSGNGSIHAVAWASSTSPANVGVKFLNGPIYTMVHGGYRRTNGDDRLAPGLVIGGHLPVEPFFVEVDAGYSKEAVRDGDAGDGDDIVRYRALVGYEVLPALSVFGGVGLRQRLPRLWVSSEEPRELEHRPEVLAGVQLF